MIKFLGITGKARSGKDTVANYFMDHLQCSVRYALADPMKDALFAMLGAESLSAKAELMRNKEEPIEGIGHSPRAILQALGTEGLRNSLDENFWINLLYMYSNSIEEIERDLGNHEGMYPIYIVVPDIRFNNEAEFIKNQGGIVVKVTRPNHPEVRAHSSEQGVSTKYVDYHIENDGSLEDLKQKVKSVVEEGELNE